MTIKKNIHCDKPSVLLPNHKLVSATPEPPTSPGNHCCNSTLAKAPHLLNLVSELGMINDGVMVLQLSIVIWIKDGVGWSCSKSPSSLPAPICSHKRVQVAHEESSKLVTDSPISPTSLLDFAILPQSLVWTLQFWTHAGMELRYLMPRFHWHWQCLCTETFQWISKWIKLSIQFYLNGMCITVPVGTWKILKDDINLY